MKSIITVLLCFLLLIVVSGCASVVMPYAENPLCSKGVAGGYCGTVSDVNEVTDKEMDERKKDKKNKNSKKKEVINR